MESELDDEDLDKLIEAADPGDLWQSHYDKDVHMALIELKFARKRIRFLKLLFFVSIFTMITPGAVKLAVYLWGIL